MKCEYCRADEHKSGDECHPSKDDLWRVIEKLESANAALVAENERLKNENEILSMTPEVVDKELRSMGLDPDAVAEEGRALGKELMDKRHADAAMIMEKEVLKARTQLVEELLSLREENVRLKAELETATNVAKGMLCDLGDVLDPFCDEMMTAKRDEWKRRAEASEQERDALKAKLEMVQAWLDQPDAPTISLAEIMKE